MNRLEHPFTLSVPCLLRPARAGAPLVVALHGRWERETTMEKRIRRIRPDLAFAFPRAPYPDELKREGRIRVGYSWYQYTGDPAAFRESLRVTGDWLLGLIDRVVEETRADPARVCLMGFSQGGYLAGSLAMTRPERFAGVAVLGARYKTELLDGDAPELTRLRLFAGHGSRDRSVAPGPAAAHVEELRRRGVSVDHREYDCGHRVVPEMVEDALAYLLSSSA
jgi:phospholipase/carboxylesterase